MKCRSCESEYRMRETQCPYCGTENWIGRAWKDDRERNARKYEDVSEQPHRYTLSYVLGRLFGTITLAVLGIWVLFFVVTTILTKGSMFSSEDGPTTQENRMVKYYEEGDYGRLYEYMREHKLVSKENYVYAQAAFMYQNYRGFEKRRFAFEYYNDEEKLEDEYTVISMLDYAMYVFRNFCGDYSEVCEENQALYDYYCGSVKGYLMGGLGLTEEEIAVLENPGPFDLEMSADYRDRIFARRVWR